MTIVERESVFPTKSRQLQKQLSKINDRITEIEDLEDKVMSVKDAVDNNNLETAESPTNNLTFYHFVFSDEALTLPNHLAESDKLFASFEFIIQDSDFDLLGLSQLANLLIKDFVGKYLIEL